MSNEEKILSMLTEMQADMKIMQSDINTIKNGGVKKFVQMQGNKLQCSTVYYEVVRGFKIASATQLQELEFSKKDLGYFVNFF